MNVFDSDVIRYKPNIIFLGLELSRCLRLIPGINSILINFNNNSGLNLCELFSSTKKVETNTAFYAWKKIKHVGNVLFVQGHSTPGPFGKFNISERQEIGGKVKQIYENKTKCKL